MPTKTRVALFIDAENASTKHLSVYLAHCNQLGKRTIVRCYGGSAGLKKWETALAQHPIVWMQTPPSAAKENASDFALTIDAVSLLHRDMFDHAIIASSDADFTQLAMHIREHGKGVHGIGEAKATQRLRDAFDEFITVGEKTARSAAVKKPAAPHQEEGPAAKRLDIDTKKLLAIYGELAAGGDPVTLQLFGRTLSKQMPNYKKGHRTLENFLKKSGRFEIAEGNVHLISGGKPGQIRP